MADEHELIVGYEALLASGLTEPQALRIMRVKLRVERGLVSEETQESKHLVFLRYLAEREGRTLDRREDAA